MPTTEPSLAEAHERAEAASLAAERELPSLRTERQRLALDALSDRKAAAQLEEIEAQIAALERDHTRAALVVAEVRARGPAAWGCVRDGAQRCGLWPTA